MEEWLLGLHRAAKHSSQQFEGRAVFRRVKKMQEFWHFDWEGDWKHGWSWLPQSSRSHWFWNNWNNWGLLDFQFINWRCVKLFSSKFCFWLVSQFMSYVPVYKKNAKGVSVFFWWTVEDVCLLISVLLWDWSWLCGLFYLHYQLPFSDLFWIQKKVSF